MRSLSLVVLLASISSRVHAAAIGPVGSLDIVNLPISPDGISRDATLADGLFPGPLIRAEKGDDFKINVINSLSDTTMDLVTSIHWHGIFQRTTNYVDGAAFVTQCPIIPGGSFLYQFNAEEQTGTYWYHSHFKAQYCDGLRGALVIYDPEDPHASLYDVDDEDTVITLADWYHYVSTEAPAGHLFDSTLINGVGRYSGGPSHVALAVVNVVASIRYRLRLVSISCDPAYDFSIDGHNLTIIEVEGNNVQPLVVDSLRIFAGQRYSVVLNASQPIGNYWIRALPNIEVRRNHTNLANLAILRYFGASDENPSDDPTFIPTSVLPLNETDLHPLDVTETPVPGEPFQGGADININLDVTFNAGSFLINDVAFEPPTVPVLLQILNGVQASDLVPAGSIYSLDPDKSVEISLPALNSGTRAGGPHPIHLHGHAFHVVRSAGSTAYNYDDPVIRDVVSMGNTGDNVTIRFFTDNPGPWFLHCHIDWHLEEGFAVVFAEDVPGVSNQDVVTEEWRDLCPAYNNFIG